MPKPKHPDKLLVEVRDGRYECYGDPDNPLLVNFLMEQLREAGGVAESNPDGYYYFGVEFLDMNQIVLTFEPYED